jgi:hypothetical protein
MGRQLAQLFFITIGAITEKQKFKKLLSRSLIRAMKKRIFFVN